MGPMPPNGSSSVRRLWVMWGLLLSAAMFAPEVALAAGMPWEDPICKVVLSLQGPVAGALAVAIFVFAGLAYAWGDSDIFKMLSGTLIGICIAVFAAQILAVFGVRFGC